MSISFRRPIRRAIRSCGSKRGVAFRAGIELEPVQYPEVNDDPATRRGFDRLRTHGFTIQEVAAIRSYFNSHVHIYANRQPAREGTSHMIDRACSGQGEVEGGGVEGRGDTEGCGSVCGLAGESTDERRNRMEEEWMERQSDTSEFGTDVLISEKLNVSGSWFNSCALRAHCLSIMSTWYRQPIWWSVCRAVQP
jgi:hypothetical protein